MLKIDKNNRFEVSEIKYKDTKLEAVFEHYLKVPSKSDYPTDWMTEDKIRAWEKAMTLIGPTTAELIEEVTGKSLAEYRDFEFKRAPGQPYLWCQRYSNGKNRGLQRFVDKDFIFERE